MSLTTDVPSYQSTNVPIDWCTQVPLCQCANAMCQYANLPMYQFIYVTMYQFINVTVYQSMYQFKNVPTYQCINVALYNQFLSFNTRCCLFGLCREYDDLRYKLVSTKKHRTAASKWVHGNRMNKHPNSTSWFPTHLSIYFHCCFLSYSINLSPSCAEC